MNMGFLAPLGSGVPVTFNVTIPSYGWTAAGTSAGYYQDVNIDGVFETDVPLVDINCDHASKVVDYRADWAKLWKIETYNGKIRCYATSELSKDLPIILIMQR